MRTNTNDDPGDAPGFIFPTMDRAAVDAAVGCHVRVAEWSSLDAIAAAGKDANPARFCGSGGWAGDSGPVVCERIKSGIPAAGYLGALDAARAKLEQAGEAGGADYGVSKRRRSVIREEGEEVDVDRMLEGRPDCWRTTVRGRVAPVYRLGWEHANTCLASQSFYAEVGATVAVLADYLTARGFSLEVVGLWSGRGYRNGFGAAIEAFPILPAGSPFDAAALGAWADAAMPRRLIQGRVCVVDGIAEVMTGTPKLAAALGLDWLIGTTGPAPNATASAAVAAFLKLIGERQQVGAGV